MSEHQITCSAPGSVMLLGEHAVLHGGPALVAAVDRRIYVSLQPRDDNQVIIHAGLLGHYQAALETLMVEKPFTFVIAAIKHYQTQLKNGFILTIHSDFSANLGLGSSAAVTVATLATLQIYLHQQVEQLSLIKLGCQIVRSVQGVGSGADIAASVLGGIVCYRSDPFEAKKIDQQPVIGLVYSGSKMATVDVIHYLDNLWRDSPQYYHHCLTQIAQCAQHGCDAVIAHSWQQLAEQIQRQQQLMAELKLTNDHLTGIVEQLNDLPSVNAAKISGAGLGDCILALGEIPANYFPLDKYQQTMGVEQIDAAISLQGVQHDTQ